MYYIHISQVFRKLIGSSVLLSSSNPQGKVLLHKSNYNLGWEPWQTERCQRTAQFNQKVVWKVIVYDETVILTGSSNWHLWPYMGAPEKRNWKVSNFKQSFRSAGQSEAMIENPCQLMWLWYWFVSIIQATGRPILGCCLFMLLMQSGSSMTNCLLSSA